MTRAPLLSTYTTISGQETLVGLVGEMDVDTAPGLRPSFRTWLDRRPDSMVVDLSAVTFCDCSGLNLLLWARRTAAGGGTAFQVRSPARQPARLLTLSGTAALLGVSPRSHPLAS